MLPDHVLLVVPQQVAQALLGGLGVFDAAVEPLRVVDPPRAVQRHQHVLLVLRRNLAGGVLEDRRPAVVLHHLLERPGPLEPQPRVVLALAHGRDLTERLDQDDVLKLVDRVGDGADQQHGRHTHRQHQHADVFLHRRGPSCVGG